MSSPVLALAVTAAPTPIISISALPPSSNSHDSSSISPDTSRSYPLSAAAPFNFLLLAPIFALISLGFGVLAGMLLYRRCSRRIGAKGAMTKNDSNEEYSIGLRLFRPRTGEDGGFVVGTTSEGDSQTPTAEKPESATLLSHLSCRSNPDKSSLASYEYEQDSDTWDASDIKTPRYIPLFLFILPYDHDAPRLNEPRARYAQRRALARPDRRTFTPSERVGHIDTLAREVVSSMMYAPTPLFKMGCMGRSRRLITMLYEERELELEGVAR